MPEMLSVFSQLVRLEIELWNAVDARLRRDHDLPLSRFEPLRVIGSRPGCRVNDIATDLGLTVGGVSKLVDRIESAGMCRRVPNPQDRRSSLLELTDAGRQILAEATQSAEDELHNRIGTQLQEPATRRLSATLNILREANREFSAAATLDD